MKLYKVRAFPSHCALQPLCRDPASSCDLHNVWGSLYTHILFQSVNTEVISTKQDKKNGSKEKGSFIFTGRHTGLGFGSHCWSKTLGSPSTKIVVNSASFNIFLENWYKMKTDSSRISGCLYQHSTMYWNLWEMIFQSRIQHSEMPSVQKKG